MAEITRHMSLPSRAQKCEVCATLALAFNDNLKGGSAILGTFEEVMLSTTCQLHPRMIRKFFGSKLDNNHVERFDVLFGGDDHGYVFLRGIVPGPIGMIYAMGLYPFGLPPEVGRMTPSRILDPQWIDHDSFYRWKMGCESQKNADCQVKTIGSRLPHYHPDWLIDTWRMCLTPGNAQASYVALSYVWGRSPFFKTSKGDLARLQIDSALSDKNYGIGIPRTIRDAMAVAGLLKERYLWVDALCIVQDDEERRDKHINNMATIFANASITIVADQGKDAHSGLHGLRGISRPRNIRQEIFRLEEGLNVLQCQRFAYDHRISSPHSQRGWTFQERLFSTRTLTFQDETVRWQCACSKIDEECEPWYGSRIGRSRKNMLSTIYPVLFQYRQLVEGYNMRILTYPENALAAFAGTLSMLSQTFRGGFVCGLPTLFFDLALCWRPIGETEPRISSNGSPPFKVGLPSWSWVGLKCEIHHLSWSIGLDYIKKSYSSSNHDTACQIIPTVEWYSRKWNDTRLKLLQGTRMVYDYRTLYFHKEDEAPPVGWSRLLLQESSDAQVTRPSPPYLGVIPRCFYKHESIPETEFWYPIPLCDDAPGPNNMLDTLLSCRTQRVRLFMSERISKEFPVFSIRDKEGRWLGALQRDHGSPPYQAVLDKRNDPDQWHPCELVSISRGFIYESSRGGAFAEWKLEERPKGLEIYEFYNVLWVEWLDEIACRKGLGRIMKSAWEAQGLEWIDLTLG